jgi:hypothetical protein
MTLFVSRHHCSLPISDPNLPPATPFRRRGKGTLCAESYPTPEAWLQAGQWQFELVRADFLSGEFCHGPLGG